MLAWRVHDDLCGSDHFPVILDFLNLYQAPRKLLHWYLKRADWNIYENRVKLIDQRHLALNDLVEYLHREILRAARCSIPQFGRTQRRHSVLWWNDEL